nr:phosphatidate cytidylyltransferase, photoreceptor-specific-like isoform X1 [Leptinotarsa decemlineata]
MNCDFENKKSATETTMDEKPETRTSKPLRWTLKTRIKSNGLKRTITGLSLVAYLAFSVYTGVPLILLNTLIIQMKCFDEVIIIAYSRKKIPDIPHFRTLNWYFVITANYFFSGETLAQYLEVYVKKYRSLQLLVTYHRFISFCLYLAGIIWFLALVRRNRQNARHLFGLFFWTFFLTVLFCLQSHLIVHTTFEGIIWCLVPLMLVIINDVFAYVFGRHYGKRQLISLSPKKTVEGFIMGGISTFVLGALLSYLCCRVQYLVCPVKYVEQNDSIVLDTNCTRSPVFKVTEYQLGNSGISFNTYPFILHSFSLSFFASVIAPFGGFFASGFKRAVNVKNFGDTIPGHGGIMDRFDCQYLMVTFVNVYVSTFIRTPYVDQIFQKIVSLSEQEQLEFYHSLKEFLYSSNLKNIQ